MECFLPSVSKPLYAKNFLEKDLDRYRYTLCNSSTNGPTEAVTPLESNNIKSTDYANATVYRILIKFDSEDKV